MYIIYIKVKTLNNSWRFLKILKKLHIPEAWREALENLKKSAKFKISALGPTSLVPGDLVQTSYHTMSNGRLVVIPRKTYLVVSTRRAPLGSFLSTKSNRLLCCYEVNQTLPTLTTVIQQLYNNKNNCSYYAGLDLIFGSGSFRTFKYQGLFDLQEIYIRDKVLEENQNKKEDD